MKTQIESVKVPATINLVDRMEIDSLFAATRSPRSWASNHRGLRARDGNRGELTTNFGELFRLRIAGVTR